MDELSQYFGKYRGRFGCLAAFLVVALAGGIGMWLSPTGEPSDIVMLTGFVVAIALGVGIAKNARWARVVSGIVLSLVGAALAIFILVDFARYLTGGHSYLSGPGSSSFGAAVAIVFMTGAGLLGAGLYLLGRLK